MPPSRSCLRQRAATAGDTYFIKADGNLPGTESFVADFPQFCLNVRNAEQNVMSIAGGIASTGWHAYFLG